VPFKRDVYERALRHLAPLAEALRDSGVDLDAVSG